MFDLVEPVVARDTHAVTAGLGVVDVVRVGARSIVSRAYATSPLRLLTPHNHGHAAWVYTSSFGGGLVDGDRLAMRIGVGAAAAAYVSTQASTKVYCSPQGTSAALDARVGPDGLLVLAPDPVVCFAGSRYRQVHRLDLDPGAALVALDWITSGRRAFGERWAFDEYSSRLSIRVAGTLVVHDALVLRPEDGHVAARMGRFEAMAVMILIGDRLRADADAILAMVAAIPVGRRPDLLLAATPLRCGGCVLRVAGTTTEAVARVVRTQLAFVTALLGDDPWARKW